MKDPKKERARRVVAYLEQRTVERGCTPAEAEQAARKAAEIRNAHALGSERTTYQGDPLDIQIDPAFAAFVMGFSIFHGQVFVHEQVKRKKKACRPGTRARFAQFWRR